MKKFNFVFVFVILLILLTVGILIGNNRKVNFVSGEGYSDYFNQCIDKDNTNLSNGAKAGKCIKELQDRAREAETQLRQTREDYLRVSGEKTTLGDENEKLTRQLRQTNEFRRLENSIKEDEKRELERAHFRVLEERDKREKDLEEEIKTLNEQRNKEVIQNQVLETENNRLKNQPKPKPEIREVEKIVYKEKPVKKEKKLKTEWIVLIIVSPIVLISLIFFGLWFGYKWKLRKGEIYKFKRAKTGEFVKGEKL